MYSEINPHKLSKRGSKGLYEDSPLHKLLMIMNEYLFPFSRQPAVLEAFIFSIIILLIFLLLGIVFGNRDQIDGNQKTPGYLRLRVLELFPPQSIHLVLSQLLLDRPRPKKKFLLAFLYFLIEKSK